MPSAREAVVKVLARQARRFETMPPLSPAVEQLDERDARLAMAIHHVVLERWITLEFLLEKRLRGAVAEMEPMLQGILLSGAAQLLFMNVPPHAVVSESVKLAKRRVRPGAGGLVNAVLRRVSEMAAERIETGGWTPSRDHLPWQHGAIRLYGPLLPVVDRLAEYLAVATSHPQELVEAWLARYGREQTISLLLHSLKEPPTIVHAGDDLPPDLAESHEKPGYAVWRGDAASLIAYLSGGSERWAQDPTSGTVVAATADLAPSLIVDYCAGRGTKTRQLAATHPEAQIIATDPDRQRFRELRASFTGHERVRVVEFKEIEQYRNHADLLLLDVPCSNTGVLARRTEARYRYRRELFDSLEELQRDIVTESAKLLKREGDRIAGTVVYSTCSIEPGENEDQAAWAAEQLGLRIIRSESTLPGGEGTGYHDGGFFAMLTT